ncbi:MAG: TIGR04282 family arsenosugar biosynthesis glycosyltransferase [Gammaproteobacteria bacterium]
MGKNNSTCCLIFTKNPEPGKTKTRLIPAIGETGAFEAHVKLLKHTVTITSEIKNIDFILYTTTTHSNEIIVNLAKEHNLTIEIQKGNNLGDRMYQASDENLSTYSHCIIIGVDCPELTADYLLNARKALSSGYDAVIGPAHDGGYVLIGFNKSVKTIFTNIAWGENTVLKSTLDNFEKLNIKYKKLPTLHDVDTQEDLQYLNKI